MSALKIYIGIDLGSTTTKAVVLNGAGEVIGRGITNSRSNYDVACQVVREEALVRTRFTLTRQAIQREPELADVEKAFFLRWNATSACDSISIRSPGWGRRCAAPPRSRATRSIGVS